MSHLKLVSDGGEREREREMFGCTEAEAKDLIKGRVTAMLGNPNMALSSILDDASKAVDPKTATQLINRVKLALILATRMELWTRLT